MRNLRQRSREGPRQWVVVQSPIWKKSIRTRLRWWVCNELIIKSLDGEQEEAHRYWRLLSCWTESGISPENLLLERSKVCSFGSKPSSGGILPEMLLFCNDLQTKIGSWSLEIQTKKESFFFDKKTQIFFGRRQERMEDPRLSESYTCPRLVRFPIDSDRVPERDWLGAPLKQLERERKS